MDKKTRNRILSFIGIIVFFLVLAYGFVPEVLNGKIVDQSDISGYIGMSNETTSWNKAHPDDKTAWTGSMFGGMPTTMLTGNDEGDWTKWLYDLLLTGKRPASYLFISLVGAFLMLLALGINGLIAAGGAVAVTFCSYNMQIIQVGHNSKMLALAFLPWVLAGVIYTYRSALKDGRWLPKTILGAALFALALDFQIKANHVQISYYLAIIIFSYVIVLLVKLLSEKDGRAKFGRFAAASGLLLVLGIAGIGANANRLIPTYEYTRHTMRGGSELSGGSGEKSKGLDLEYATQWSYGWEELPNMMIPDYNGGASATAMNPSKSETVKVLRAAGQPNTRQIAKALPTYWGPQPFTAGPMYMGAITVFLFILGLGLCRGKERWWMLIPTLIATGLGVGYHFMPFTEFWYYHMPFYSKFRTVSMALVILQFTLPMLGFLTLDRIVKERYTRKDFLKYGIAALIITGGFCLLSFSGIGRTFTGPGDAGQPDFLIDALAADRLSLLRHDSVVSLVLVCATFLLLLWGYSFKEKDNDTGRGGRLVLAGFSICILGIANLWAVGKRYLNSGHFVTPVEFRGQFTERPVDKVILSDKDPDHRVLDLTVNVFNDSHPSYFHKNIGGYSPVKLQRYQDLIDRYLVGEINSIYKSIQGKATISEVEEALGPLPVLSMLNDKYIILDDNLAPVRNPQALGSCWLVTDIASAETPEDEISLLGKVDLASTAVVGKDFAEARAKAGSACASLDSLSAAGDTLSIVTYAPNELKYSYRTSSERTAVFSEIFYPDGWTAWLEDGTPVELFRADWTLRAAVLPAGEHTLTMRFEPKSYAVSSGISRGCSGVLLLLVLAGIGFAAADGRKKKKI